VRLARRLWLHGALLPALAMLGALGIAGELFRADLERSLDRALLAQAAVESVSLFDGPPGHEVHLHMEMSHLAEQVRPFAPQGYVYQPDGQLMMHYPPTSEGAPKVPRRVPERREKPPVLSTEQGEDGSRWREVMVSVLSPNGEWYGLRLVASMAQVDHSAKSFFKLAFSMAAVTGLLLLAVQTLLARRLARRLAVIRRNLEHLREGHFPPSFEEDPEQDEIAQVSEALREAMTRVHGAREAQERLIANAAHELRTPLALMRTSMDLALRRDRETEELRASLRDARAEVDRLAVLADSLLDMATAGRGSWDRKKGDLGSLLAQAVEGARAEAERRWLLIHLEAPAQAEAWFDAGSLRQAMDNLLGNALKFSTAHGEIHVKLVEDAGRYRVSVRDAGPGIPPEEREAVFEPFHRGEGVGAKPGSGLGLAVVREVAKRHGGRAYVSPAEGLGAELVLELPASQRLEERRSGG
jgi:signal transduction histidine kinase